MIIDLTYLNDISDGDADTKRQLIDLFISQAGEIKERFNKAAESNNIVEIGRTAHLAKSTTKVMGINVISNAMKVLQDLAEEGRDTERYPQLIQIYLDNIPVAISELQQEISCMTQQES